MIKSQSIFVEVYDEYVYKWRFVALTLKHGSQLSIELSGELPLLCVYSDRYRKFMSNICNLMQQIVKINNQIKYLGVILDKKRI
jgi:hypothetical protein